MQIIEVKVKTNAFKNEVKLINNKKLFVKTAATPEKWKSKQTGYSVISKIL